MFQSSPGRQTGCDGHRVADLNGQQVVSILTRSPDRVRPVGIAVCALVSRRFNPHPVARPGATPGHQEHRRRLGRVSILTRSPDRVRLVSLTRLASSNEFQSSPGRQTGCDEPLS